MDMIVATNLLLCGSGIIITDFHQISRDGMRFGGWDSIVDMILTKASISMLASHTPVWI